METVVQLLQQQLKQQEEVQQQQIAIQAEMAQHLQHYAPGGKLAAGTTRVEAAVRERRDASTGGRSKGHSQGV
jgi:hypothetical protein